MAPFRPANKFAVTGANEFANTERRRRPHNVKQKKRGKVKNFSAPLAAQFMFVLMIFIIEIFYSMYLLTWVVVFPLKKGG